MAVRAAALLGCAVRRTASTAGSMARIASAVASMVRRAPPSRRIVMVRRNGPPCGSFRSRKCLALLVPAGTPEPPCVAERRVAAALDAPETLDAVAPKVQPVEA
ncbi:MAG: hypothetical protein ICV73_27900 [Acetobacteraceae bacterium]|nr:hypothetical protein [Acetobacteraceae bacterium]